jgi:putative ABC transport system ATP-binding protein
MSRGAAVLLDGVSAHFPAGRCSAVVGASGAGKSTLLRVLNRLVEPTAGRVLLDGVPLVELDVLSLRRRVGLVAQQPVLLTDVVADEVRVGRADIPDSRVVELLVRVGLPAEFAGRRTAELSGGEGQRLCLARALAIEPEVLLLDEPTSALDGPNVARIGDIVRDHTATGGSVVLVSHDLAVVRRLADRVVVLDHGRLLDEGRAAEMNGTEAG